MHSPNFLCEFAFIKIMYKTSYFKDITDFGFTEYVITIVAIE